MRTVPPLDCNSQTSWTHGSSLINYMKMTEFVGLSGRIKFDTYGKRTDFHMNVLELRNTGLETIGKKMKSYVCYTLRHFKYTLHVLLYVYNYVFLYNFRYMVCRRKAKLITNNGSH